MPINRRKLRAPRLTFSKQDRYDGCHSGACPGWYSYSYSYSYSYTHADSYSDSHTYSDSAPYSHTAEHTHTAFSSHRATSPDAPALETGINHR